MSKYTLLIPNLIIFWLLFFDLNLPIVGPYSIFITTLLIISIYPLEFIKSIKSVYIYDLIIFLYTFLTFVLIRTAFGEIHFLLLTLKISLVILISSVYTIIICKKFGVKYYISLFTFVILLQSISPYLYLISEQYKSLVISLQFSDYKNIHDREIMSIRKSFLSGTGGLFGMAIGLGLSLVILTWFKIKNYITNNYTFLVMFMLVSISAVIAGRTAIIFIVFSMIMIFFNLKLKTKFFYIVFFIIIFLLLALFFSTPDFIITLTKEYPFLKWLLEPLINYIIYDSFSSTSTNHLESMYFIPELNTLLFGDGLFYNKDGGYYGGIDVGYLRQILFGGILIIVFSIVYLFISTKYYDNKFFRYGLISLLLLVHAKGLIILSTVVTMSIYASFTTFSYIYYKNKKDFNER